MAESVLGKSFLAASALWVWIWVSALKGQHVTEGQGDQNCEGKHQQGRRS